MPTNQPKITPKSRKEDILAAHNRLLAQVTQLRGEPSSAAIAQAADMTVAAASLPKTADDVVTALAGIHNLVTGQTRSLGAELEQLVTDVENARKLRIHEQKQLEDVYGITQALHTLEALHAATAEHKVQAAAQRAEIEAHWVREDDERKTRRARDEETWSYDFARTKRDQRDGLVTEIEGQRKQADREVEARVEVVSALEREQNAAIARASELESEVETLVEAHAAQLKAEVARAAAAAKQTADHTAQLAAKDAAADLAVEKGRVEALQAQLKAAVAENAQLHDWASKASDRSADVAKAALTAAAGKETNAAVQSTLANLGQPSSRGARA